MSSQQHDQQSVLYQAVAETKKGHGGEDISLGYMPGGEQNEKLLGVIGLERLNGTLRAHRARIWGLVISIKHRRQGISRQLCVHTIEQARKMTVEKLSLELTGEAVAALHLYRNLGFRIESVEPLALKMDGRYLDEIRMALCF